MKNATGSQNSTDPASFVGPGGGTAVDWQRIVIWTTLPILCWLLMQALHETGHVLGAMLTGGRVVRLDLHPLHISSTQVAPNPHPATVCWSGPLMGVTLPVVMWLIAGGLRFRFEYYFRFLAGFCLVANGAYLGSASITPVGDAQDLLRMGISLVWLNFFAAVTIPAGFCLWNGQGRYFGIGTSAKNISTTEALALLSCLLVLIVSESLIM